MEIDSIRNIEDVRKVIGYIKDSTNSESVFNPRLISESLRFLARKNNKEEFRRLVEAYCEFYKVRGIEEERGLSNLEWLCRFADHGAKIGCFNGEMNLSFPIRQTQQYFCQFYGACLSCGG